MDAARTGAGTGVRAYLRPFEASPDGVLVTSPDGTVHAANAAACSLLGHDETELCRLGRAGIADTTDGRWVTALERRRRDGHVHGRLRLRRADASTVEVDLSSVVFPHHEETLTYVILRDASAAVEEAERAAAGLRAAEESGVAAAHRATHDALTGLLNRPGLEAAAGRAPRVLVDRPVTVLFLDLDHFTQVNDTLGHAAGDQVLAILADRLLTLAGPDDVVARFGGDEFVVLLFDTAGEPAARRIEEVLAVVRIPVPLLATAVCVTTSIGVAAAPSAQDVAGLVCDAVTAAQAAKAAGREQAVRFDEAMRARSVRRVTVTAELARAIPGGELVLHYLPSFDLPTLDRPRCAVLDVEALVRWQHPTRGLLAPGEFIDVAEESGQIVDLGRWVIAAAAAQAVRWADVPDLRVWVNVSPRQLARPGLAAQLAAQLTEAGLPPHRFGIELTESTLTGRVQLLDELTAIHDLGIAVAIDDFGTGYSSLSRLGRLPVDVIKIDRSFVHDLDSPRGEALVVAIITLARSLGAHVIAEGVETVAQLGTLARLGCDTAAGFLLARPGPALTMPWEPSVEPPAPIDRDRPGTDVLIPRQRRGSALVRLGA